MKDEIKNVKMGSGSTVCSEASAGLGLGPGTSTCRRRLLLGGMKRSFHERWNSKVGSQSTSRATFKVSQTMKLRNS